MWQSKDESQFEFFLETLRPTAKNVLDSKLIQRNREYVYVLYLNFGAMRSPLDGHGETLSLTHSHWLSVSACGTRASESAIWICVGSNVDPHPLKKRERERERVSYQTHT